MKDSIEALRRIYNDAISGNEIEEDVEEIKKDYEIIKQDLERFEKCKNENCDYQIKNAELQEENEELKQVIEILKNNYPIKFLGYNKYGAKPYEIMFNGYIMGFEKEQYELLKEVLGNE